MSYRDGGILVAAGVRGIYKSKGETEGQGGLHNLADKDKTQDETR